MVAILVGDDKAGRLEDPAFPIPHLPSREGLIAREILVRKD